MENLLSRYRNVTILVAVLFAQVLGLAVQVRRSPDQTSGRLIRVWVVTAITPFEKAIVIVLRRRIHPGASIATGSSTAIN